jgi:hypothetical protein
MKKIIILLTASILFSSCYTTNRINWNVDLSDTAYVVLDEHLELTQIDNIRMLTHMPILFAFTFTSVYLRDYFVAPTGWHTLKIGGRNSYGDLTFNFEKGHKYRIFTENGELKIDEYK